ncbi:hypothetical protein RND81_06G068600 [Saponaria officinalis]|uniref:CCHC-type domain-containing protein n=1 Tax=Saponaria officinalis TaxID=3572 RepID=A0AAW1K8C7_SAPOF
MENCEFIALSKTLDSKEAYHITAPHLNGLIKQQNYANLFLKIIGEQLGSLHDKLDRVISLLNNKTIKNQENCASSSALVSAPLIASLQKPPEIKNFITTAKHEWEEKVLAQAQVNKQVQDLLLEQMKNLSLKTLDDSISQENHDSSGEDEINRWYKDAFLCRVMELPESSSAHWKAKFIDGLPHLFAERVKTILRDQSGSIPYNEYSYGRLIGACTEQGLKLCNEIKLNQQIKRQNLAERNQVGDFCEQFGMDMPPYPNKKRKAAREINNKSFHRKKRNKPYFKGNQFDKNKKKFIKPYRKRRFKSKTDNKIICYKCNRIGHYAKDCWTKKAISTLEIDDNIKEKLYELLSTSDRDGTYSSSSDSSDNEIKNMDNDTYYSDSSSTICEPCLKGKECVKDNDLYNLISQFEEHRINVLDNNSWVELLKVVKDP